MNHHWLYGVMCLLSCEVRALCSGVRIPVGLRMYVGSYLRHRSVQCALLRRLNPQPMETIWMSLSWAPQPAKQKTVEEFALHNRTRIRKLPYRHTVNSLSAWHNVTGIWDSSVAVVSGLQTRRTGVCFLAQAEDNYLLRNVPKDVARTQPGLRRPEREVEHSTYILCQIKNKWSNISSPHTPLWFVQGQLYILPYYTFFELQNIWVLNHMLYLRVATVGIATRLHGVTSRETGGLIYI